MRICYWGTYDRDYIRNQVMISGLRQADAQISECHASLWQSHDERVRQIAGGSHIGLILRAIGLYVELSARLLVMRRPNVLILGYPGQIDALIAGPICRLRRIPLVLDAFISLYETAVEDRALIRRGSWPARLLAWAEKRACRRADLVLCDTQADADDLRTRYDLTAVAPIWVGAAESKVADAPAPCANPDDPYDVLWAGTFIPLHGVEYILGAAHLLQDSCPRIRFTLIGSGQTYARMRELASTLGLTNVQWGPAWLHAQALAERTRRADIVLGIFGTSAKAARVIPNKAYAALAQARPLITADTPGIREALVHGRTAWLCPPGDAEALATAIHHLCEHPDLAARLATQGYALYRQQFTPQAIGKLTLALLQPLVG